MFAIPTNSLLKFFSSYFINWIFSINEMHENVEKKLFKTFWNITFTQALWQFSILYLKKQWNSKEKRFMLWDNKIVLVVVAVLLHIFLHFLSLFHILSVEEISSCYWRLHENFIECESFFLLLLFLVISCCYNFFFFFISFFSITKTINFMF